ncbi:MAG TPA: NAD(P)-binding domain-containing protein, partial [Candidatus Eisenbacteria bacterium]
MVGILKRYARWLHTQWPSGPVEPLPATRADGTTGVPGVRVVGDLTGIPLLKFALDSGARAARAIEPAPGPGAGVLDLVIVGGGVSGMAAAVEARSRGLRFEVLEADEALSTVANIPSGKPIFTYPRSMTPAGSLQVRAGVKEDLLAELRRQVAEAGIVTLPARALRLERRGGQIRVHLEGREPLDARHAIVAIGRSGDHRMLGVPGEHLPHVFNRLQDPAAFSGRRALVVGGGDTAAETAIALAEAGARVTLAVRGPALARPKPEIARRVEALAREGGAPGAPARLALRLSTRVREIRADEVVLERGAGATERIPSDVVFVMTGREPPLGFFRRSGLAIAGEMTPRRWIALGAFVLFCAWLYDWKSGGAMSALWYARDWFPTSLPALLAGLGGSIAAAAADRRTLIGTLAISAASPSFWYTLAYSTVVVVFGAGRIRRRRTPYVTAQTLTLMAVQVGPLFLLPEIVLPLLDVHGWLPRGLANALFPVVGYGHGREFWRAYGLILAWPLDVYNIFTHRPLWAWIAIGFLQT